MPLKPLNVDGEDFLVTVDVDHNVTSLFTLPEGCFYSVESLIIDPFTGVPLRPVVDYMYFQQDISISKTTAKQTCAIIQLRNKNITRVVVKGKYSHGVEQTQLDYWAGLCISHKDVPGWMNWCARLDEEIFQSPSMDRWFDQPAIDYTLSDVQVEFNYLIDLCTNGDGNIIPHVEYWQNQLFKMASDRQAQVVTDITNSLLAMKTDTGGKVGDFKFTDGDGVTWANGINKIQYENVLLGDRGTEAVGTYRYLPEGGQIPSRRTNLFNLDNRLFNIDATIITDKSLYSYKETMTVNVNINTVNAPLSPNAKLQVVGIDGYDRNLILAEFDLIGIVSGKQWTFNVPLDTLNGAHNLVSKFVVRIPQYMWIDPVIITVNPNSEVINGYIDVALLGRNNIGQVTSSGFVQTIDAIFTKVDSINQPQTLYVHLLGNFPLNALDPAYSVMQTYTFNPNFTTLEQTLAKFRQVAGVEDNFFVNVVVSKSTNPNLQSEIVAQNIWYVTAVPVDPYINWYFSLDPQGEVRLTSIDEGIDAYLIGRLSFSLDDYNYRPNVVVISSGVGAAIEGYDFTIDRANPVKIDSHTLSYKVTIPKHPEAETKYKYLSVRSLNSNVGELWIVDDAYVTDIVGSWRNGLSLSSPVIDYAGEDSTFYLRFDSNTIADGTVCPLSLVTPSIYQNSITFPPSVTFFGGRAVAAITLNAHIVSNPDQYLRMNLNVPGKVYLTPPLLILDTKTPYYELRFVVNGNVDVITAYEGDRIQCQVRAIADASASVAANLSLGGNADHSVGASSDFTFPQGSGSLLKSYTVNSSNWTNVLIDNLFIKNPMDAAYKTLTVNVGWNKTNPNQTGRDTSLTLNMRKQGT